MKRVAFYFLPVIFILSFTSVSAQRKLAINDNVQILTPAVESALKIRFEADTIELTSIVDTKKRCDYWFATLNKEGNDLNLSLVDCRDKTAGFKNLGSRIFSASDSEKALLLYFAVSEILRDPYKNVSAAASGQSQKTDTASGVKETDPGQHATRYFFAPSSYNLEKGELYYNTVYFFVHDVQYGITDKFSLGMGTTIMFFPFYLTPKFTIPVNEKSSFSVGDILMLGTWGSKFTGNLLYGTYTRGNVSNNITFGLGYLHTNESDVTNVTNSPVLNISALLKVSSHIYFITENYSSVVKTKQEAYYNYWDPITYEGTFFNESFSQKMFFIYGMAGFRFINKNKDVRSWQFGLSYIYNSREEIPYKYRYGYWSTDAPSNGRFIAFPVIGYARKFSTRY
jgi:hypothetical protein